MLGTVSSLVFYHVQDVTGISGLNWRLMLGSALLPALFVLGMCYTIPESPRWLIGKGRYSDAFHSLTRLRHTKLQAARDLFMINALLEEEASVSSGKSAIRELFSVSRNRRAVVAVRPFFSSLSPGTPLTPLPPKQSSILMFMQQFCGINGELRTPLTTLRHFCRCFRSFDKIDDAATFSTDLRC